MRRDMALKKLTFQHTILSLEAAIILIYYDSGHARIADWVIVHNRRHKYSGLILHIVATRPMHYVLCIMHLMSLCPMMVPMQKLCKMRIMHDYVMHYEKVDCSY